MLEWIPEWVQGLLLMLVLLYFVGSIETWSRRISGRLEAIEGLLRDIRDELEKGRR